MPMAPMSASSHGAGKRDDPPSPTVIVATGDAVTAPRSSVARAEIVYVPDATCGHTAAYGGDVSDATSAPLAKNSTAATVPSASDAAAPSGMSAPAANVDPLVGSVSVIDGGWFVALTPAGCVMTMVCRPIVTDPDRDVANGFCVVPTVTKPSPTPFDGGTTYTQSLPGRAVHPHDAAFVSTAALI